MSGKGETKNGRKDAAPPAPAREDPLEDVVEEALEHSYARRMLEIDVETPKREPKTRAPAGKKPAVKKPRRGKPPQRSG